MVDYLTQLAKGRSDSTIAISPLVAGVDVGNLLLQACVLVARLSCLLLIVEGTTRDAGQLQQPGQRMVLP